MQIKKKKKGELTNCLNFSEKKEKDPLVQEIDKQIKDIEDLERKFSDSVKELEKLKNVLDHIQTI